MSLHIICPHCHNAIEVVDVPGDEILCPSCGSTWYRLQYLLTWNCKHLANANKFEHIQILNTRRRLVSPTIVTPEQLLEVNP